jgi:hypothetical protein
MTAATATHSSSLRRAVGYLLDSGADIVTIAQRLRIDPRQAGRIADEILDFDPDEPRFDDVRFAAELERQSISEARLMEQADALAAMRQAIARMDRARKGIHNTPVGPKKTAAWHRYSLAVKAFADRADIYVATMQGGVS